jgi:hypothetical protein
MYGPELYGTWCDLQVDFSCNPGNDAPFCFEQFRLNSPAAYVDVLQSQPSHPKEGHYLPDGTIIPCSSNDKEYISIVECPNGFSVYMGDETENLCVFPCTSFLFDSTQTDTMWRAYVITGLIGMMANVLIVTITVFNSGGRKEVSHSPSRKIALEGGGVVVEFRDKKRARKLPRFVSACALLGLIFNFVDTVPVAVLAADLPCAADCNDEYCHGESWLCKLQQPSEYLLLASFTLILGALMELYMKAVLSKSPSECQKVTKKFNVVTSLFIAALIGTCFAAETKLLASGSTEYRQLIVARDGFSCAPRFSSATQEMLFRTLPFMLVCLALVALTLGLARQIWVLMQNTPGATATGMLNKFSKMAGKLLLLAQIVTVLWLVRVSAAATQRPLIEGFNLDVQAFADCTLQASMSSTWQSSNGGYVELCSAIPNTGSSMLTSVVLMLCVKNLQSWVVGFVWGLSFLAVSASNLSFSTLRSVSQNKSGSVGVYVVSSEYRSEVQPSEVTQD